jgi:hypothetical protein
VTADGFDEHELGELGQHGFPAGAEVSAGLDRGLDQAADPLPALLGHGCVHDAWQCVEQWVEGADVAAQEAALQSTVQAR